MKRKRLSKLQRDEISRLLDERYVYLQLRLRRLNVLYQKNASMLDDVLNEMALINSISDIF